MPSWKLWVGLPVVFAVVWAVSYPASVLLISYPIAIAVAALRMKVDPGIAVPALMSLAFVGFGLAIGLFQHQWIPSEIVKKHRWVSATSVGWVAGCWLGWTLITMPVFRNSITSSASFPLALFGMPYLTMGFAQWVVIRRLVNWSVWWIIASDAVSLSVVWLGTALVEKYSHTDWGLDAGWVIGVGYLAFAGVGLQGFLFAFQLLLLLCHFEGTRNQNNFKSPTTS